KAAGPGSGAGGTWWQAGHPVRAAGWLLALPPDLCRRRAGPGNGMDEGSAHALPVRRRAAADPLPLWQAAHLPAVGKHAIQQSPDRAGEGLSLASTWQTTSRATGVAS